MNKLISTINNTVKVIRLLSNPILMDSLMGELERKSTGSLPPRLGKNDILYHKHYLVQVVN